LPAARFSVSVEHDNFRPLVDGGAVRFDVDQRSARTQNEQVRVHLGA
jgi:hypothetical protein